MPRDLNQKKGFLTTGFSEMFLNNLRRRPATNQTSPQRDVPELLS